MTLKVSEILTTLQDSEKVDILPPNALANYLLVLSAHINIAGMNIVDAEVEYATKWREVRNDSKTDKETDVRIKSEPEYRTLQGAKYAEKSLVETIRSIKKVLAIKSEEAHNQM